MKTVILLVEAAEDLEAARDFYEGSEPGVGDYFVDSLLADLVSLERFAGIHPVHFEFHACSRIVSLSAFIIANTVMRRRSSIYDAIRIGFAKNYRNARNHSRPSRAITDSPVRH